MPLEQAQHPWPSSDLGAASGMADSGFPHCPNHSHSTVMRTLATLIAAAAFTVFCSVSNAEPTGQPEPQIGEGSQELAERWWRWAMSSPWNTNPVSDRTGAHCAVGQRGETWFLAGGFDSAKIRRKCVVPADKALFFPLVNFSNHAGRGDTSLTCDEVKAHAQISNDKALALFAEIDGKPIGELKRYRITSQECFAMFEKSLVRKNSYTGFPAATDGYWLFIQPLARGEHVLKFGGAYEGGSGGHDQMVQDIEYVLVVQ